MAFPQVRATFLDDVFTIAERRAGDRPWFVVSGERWTDWLSDDEVKDWTPLVPGDPEVES